MRIAVYCGSSRRVGEPYLGAARETGTALAKAGHELVYGGGRTGLMGAVADAVLGAGGVAHGVILDAFIEADVHHTELSALHVVDDMRERKRGLDERADAFIALAGGLGTFEELAEILSFRKLALHDRPLVLLNTDDFFAGWLSQLDRAIADGFDKPGVRDYFAVATSPDEAVALCGVPR